MNNPPSDNTVAQLNEKHAQEVAQLNAAHAQEKADSDKAILELHSLYMEAIRIALEIAVKSGTPADQTQIKNAQAIEEKLRVQNKNLRPGFIVQRLMQTGRISDDDQPKP